jgi:hypothetical protein
MAFSFEEILVEVYRQLFNDNADIVKLGTRRFPVRRSRGHHLRQVDFFFEGHDVRGIEQSPDAHNRWAQLARSGKKVMQFLSDGRYVASIVEGKVTRVTKIAERIAKTSRHPSMRDRVLYPAMRIRDGRSS